MRENNTNNLEVNSELNNEKGNKKYNKKVYKPRKENNNGEKVVKTKKIIKNDKEYTLSTILIAFNKIFNIFYTLT